MGVSIITALIAFPIIIALILLITKGDKAKQGLAAFSTVVMTVGAIAVIVLYFASGEKFFKADYGILNYIAIVTEAILAVIIIYIGFKHRKYLLVFFALIQTAALIIFEFIRGNGIETEHNLYIDRLSMIMMVVTAVAGGLLSVYASTYLKRYHDKNPDEKDKSSRFLSSLFLSISAIMGTVVSNNMIWIYIFFELIVLTAYYMIGYGNGRNARAISLKALTAGMLGGISFVAGIIVLGGVFGTLELNTAILIGSVYGDMIAIPAAFIALSGLVMAIQMPFSGWFLKSVDSAAPAIAMISSVTSVNAGVFIILKLSAVLGMGNFAGIMIMMVGGITFITGAFTAVLQIDVRSVILHVFSAITGVIIVCAGIGTAESVWAGIMLLIFCSVLKPLIAMCVGNAEINTEKTDGNISDIFEGKPGLAACMLAAMAALFISLFEIVLMRGSSISSVADSGNILLIAVLCFGCGGIIICFIKWIGRFAMLSSHKAVKTGESEYAEDINFESENMGSGDESANPDKENVGATVKIFVVLTVLVCIIFPLISMFAVVPYLKIAFGGISAVIGLADSITGAIMILFVILIAGIFYGKKKNSPYVPENYGDILDLPGTNDIKINHIKNIFNEQKIMTSGWVASSVMIIIGMGFIIGTLVSLLGGAA